MTNTLFRSVRFLILLTLIVFSVACAQQQVRPKLQLEPLSARITSTPAPKLTNSLRTNSSKAGLAQQHPAVSPSSATQTPQPATQPLLTVTGDYVNVRVGPSTSDYVISVLAENEQAEALGRSIDGDWYAIADETFAGLGWISAFYSTVDVASDNLPILNPDGTPLPLGSTEAIQFEAGESATTLTGFVEVMEVDRYTFFAGAGQVIDAHVFPLTIADDNPMSLELVNLDQNIAYVGFEQVRGAFANRLPATGNYQLSVQTLVADSYELYLGIDNLAEGDSAENYPTFFDTEPIISTDVTVVQVTSNIAYLRYGPGLDFPIMTELPQGALFYPEARSADGNWYRTTCQNNPNSLGCEPSWIQVAETAIVEPTAPEPEIAPSFVSDSLGATIYHGPSTDYAVRGTLPANATAPLVGRSADGQWLVIAMPGRTAVGWLNINELVVSGNVLQLDTVEPPVSTSYTMPSRSISFDLGAVSASISDSLEVQWIAPWVFYASAGQLAHVELISNDPSLNYELVDMSTGLWVKSVDNPNRNWTLQLHNDGGYVVNVGPSDNLSEYTLVVTIDPAEVRSDVDTVIANGAFVDLFDAPSEHATIAGQMAGSFQIPIAAMTPDGDWYRTQCMNAPSAEGCVTSWVRTADVAATEEMPRNLPPTNSVSPIEFTAAYPAEDMRVYVYTGFGNNYAKQGPLQQQFPLPVDGISADGRWLRISCYYRQPGSVCDTSWISAHEVRFGELPVQPVFTSEVTPVAHDAVMGVDALVPIWEMVDGRMTNTGFLDSQFPIPVQGLVDGIWYLSSCDYAPVEAACAPYFVPANAVLPTSLPGIQPTPPADSHPFSQP